VHLGDWALRFLSLSALACSLQLAGFRLQAFAQVSGLVIGLRWMAFGCVPSPGFCPADLLSNRSWGTVPVLTSPFPNLWPGLGMPVLRTWLKKQVRKLMERLRRCSLYGPARDQDEGKQGSW